MKKNDAFHSRDVCGHDSGPSQVDALVWNHQMKGADLTNTLQDLVEYAPTMPPKKGGIWKTEIASGF